MSTARLSASSSAPAADFMRASSSSRRRRLSSSSCEANLARKPSVRLSVDGTYWPASWLLGPDGM